MVVLRNSKSGTGRCRPTHPKVNDRTTKKNTYIRSSDLAGDLIITFIRLQEEADRTMEVYRRLIADSACNGEAEEYRRRAGELQRKASRLLRRYKRLKRLKNAAAVGE
ncbi:MAG: hypothetical protein AB2L11_10065 [Syntrophobacteraceae bacterium]